MSIDNDVNITPLRTPAEAEACARLMSTSEPWLTLGRDYAASLKLFTDPKRESYVATQDGEVLGFVLLNMRGAFVGYIQSVCVAPEARNQGLGSRLITHAETRIFRETPNAFICASSFNPNARRLYERLGYQVVGTLTDYILPGYDEVLLRKSIAPLSEFKRNA
jgi:ribosomal protein S18 acetylase RimI-like enzyme